AIVTFAMSSPRPLVTRPTIVYPPAASLGIVDSDVTMKNWWAMLQPSPPMRAIAIVPAGYTSSAGAFSMGPTLDSASAVVLSGEAGPHGKRSLEPQTARRGQDFPSYQPVCAASTRTAVACRAGAPSSSAPGGMPLSVRVPVHVLPAASAASGT